MRLHSFRQGFSLLEALVAFAILGAILFIGSISFHHLSLKYRLHSALWEVESRLHYARFKAILEDIPVRVRAAPGYCLVEKYDPVHETWTCIDRSLLEGVDVQANTSPVFYPQGTVAPLASFLLSNSWGRYKITVAITGRVKAVKL